MFDTCYSRFRDTPVPFSCAGEDMVKEMSLSYDENNHPCLICTGTHSQQDYINSFLDGCDISIILSKISNGEIKTGVSDDDVADMSLLPSSIAEAMQLRNDLDNLLSNMSDEQKDLFLHNPFELYNQLVNSNSEPPVEPPIEPPVEPQS